LKIHDGICGFVTQLLVAGLISNLEQQLESLNFLLMILKKSENY